MTVLQLWRSLWNRRRARAIIEDIQIMRGRPQRGRALTDPRPIFRMPSLRSAPFLYQSTPPFRGLARGLFEHQSLVL